MNENPIYNVANLDRRICDCEPGAVNTQTYREWIKDTFKEDKNAQAYHKEKQRRIKEYRDMGIDPVVKYAESGTKEYREELEFYRKSGVFRGGRD